MHGILSNEAYIRSWDNSFFKKFYGALLASIWALSWFKKNDFFIHLLAKLQKIIIYLYIIINIHLTSLRWARNISIT